MSFTYTTRVKEQLERIQAKKKIISDILILTRTPTLGTLAQVHKRIGYISGNGKRKECRFVIPKQFGGQNIVNFAIIVR